MAEYRKFDSSSKYINFGARLTKDAETRKLQDGKELVRISFVDTSRHENDQDMWFEATPGDRQTGLAKYLRKGDTIGVEGKVSMRRFGDNNEKVAFAIRRAELHIPGELFAKLKERGWNPQADSKPATQSKPPAKKTTAKAPPADMPDLDDDIPF